MEDQFSYNSFFQKIYKFEKDFNTFKKESEELNKKAKDKTDKFIELMENNLNNLEVSKNNQLFQHVNISKKALKDSIAESKIKWDNFNKSEKLSKELDDKLIFFVFGKVNAGKSSFSNLFTKLSDNKNLKMFYLDGDKIKEKDDIFFQVGQTETTAQIQWVEIGSLVLVDSPGLHSMTDKNGDLTKKYLDSADAIIWLTSSSSPGQTQELTELIKEIQKEKPLLPIITKSDIEVEDWCEEANNIITITKPKVNKVREEQELDVQKRTKEYLKKENSNTKLLQPISISAKLVEDKKIKDSNIDKLFSNLENKILDEAFNYKIFKPKKILFHYFQFEIINKIENEHLLKLSEFKNNFNKQIKDLEKKEENILNQIKIDMFYEINKLVEIHQKSKNIDAIVSNLNDIASTKINELISETLEELFTDIKKISINLDSTNIDNYEDITFQYKQLGNLRGWFKKLLSWDWTDREKSKTITEIIGTDNNKLIKSLEKKININLEKNINLVFQDFYSNLNLLIESIDFIYNEMNNLKQELKKEIDNV
jgi:predicted GTPase